MPLTEIIISRFIVLNPFSRSRQSVEIYRDNFYVTRSAAVAVFYLIFLPLFLLDLCIFVVPLNSQTLLECSDLSIELI